MCVAHQLRSLVYVCLHHAWRKQRQIEAIRLRFQLLTGSRNFIHAQIPCLACKLELHSHPIHVNYLTTVAMAHSPFQTNFLGRTVETAVPNTRVTVTVLNSN